MNENFFKWFVGFVDGEGSFLAYYIFDKKRKQKRFQSRFYLGLRVDDYPILKEIKENLGIGTLHIYDVNTNLNSKPQAHFVVSSIKGCLELVKIFDKYPLKSKKIKDYKIWKKIVLVFDEREKGTRMTEEEIEKLNNLIKKLKESRIFKKKKRK